MKSPSIKESGEFEFWKDVRREGPGARIRRSASDRRGVEVKELYGRVVRKKNFNTDVV